MASQQDILQNFCRVMEISPLLFYHWKNILSEYTNFRSCNDSGQDWTAGFVVCCIGILFPCMTMNMMITGE